MTPRARDPAARVVEAARYFISRPFDSMAQRGSPVGILRDAIKAYDRALRRSGEGRGKS